MVDHEIPGAVPPERPKLVDRIREVAGAVPRKSIVVPEWDGVELFFTPMTIGDMRAVDERKPKDLHDKNLILLIMKAKYEDGRAAFTMGDKNYLETEADYIVVQRVATFMYNVAMPEGKTDREMVDGQKAVLAERPTSGSATS